MLARTALSSFVLAGLAALAVLATCCTDLASAGYDTTMCKSVLSTNNEDACYAKHDSYKQSGDCT